MISLWIVLFLIFMIKFVAIIFFSGFFSGIIPSLGDFLKFSIGTIFEFGETIGLSIRRHKEDEKNEKSSRR